MFKFVTPWGANLDPKGHHMNRLGRGQQGHAAYQISKLYAFHFQRRRTSKMGFFVSMFQLVTPGVRPVLTPGISYEQTWLRSTRRCYIPNIKDLALTVWDKKIFKNFLLYLYVKSETPKHRINFHSRAII